MSTVRHILVAVDQFPQSESALARAIELGRAHNAKVTVAHVTNTISLPGTETPARDRVDEQAMRSAREAIEVAVRMRDLGELAVDIRIESGSPSSRIVDIANELGVDLIVLRAHQRRSIREKLVGSTADRIIRATPSSVLVVKRPVERAYHEVIVAIDFGDDSVSAAIRSADLCPDVKLRLVHVMQVSAQFEMALARAGNGQEKIDAFRHSVERYAEERMSELLEHFAGRNPAPHTRLIVGDPARILVRLTRNKAIDLIAVGPFKHGPLRLALLGSVTQRLLREGDCDVLICRPQSP